MTLASGSATFTRVEGPDGFTTWEEAEEARRR